MPRTTGLRAIQHLLLQGPPNHPSHQANRAGPVGCHPHGQHGPRHPRRSLHLGSRRRMRDATPPRWQADSGAPRPYQSLVCIHHHRRTRRKALRISRRQVSFTNAVGGKKVCHSERSEEPPHFVFAFAVACSLTPTSTAKLLWNRSLREISAPSRPASPAPHAYRVFVISGPIISCALGAGSTG